MAVPADNPIKHQKEDLLGRSEVAKILADEIRSVDASEGCVVGILGPWGAGKTSLLNLVREELAKDPALNVLEFNPWLFSGTDQLLESFFLDIGAQFRTHTGRLQELASDLETYGEVVAPLSKWLPMGVWIERGRSLLKALRKVQERRKGGALAQRKQLADKLENLERPLVIVIDDIDRLRTEEIREIFKLVRLTANFPNVIYLLAFDRARVENALSEEGLVGRDYLEKILQIAHDIPVTPDVLTTNLLTEALDEGLKDIENAGPFSSAAWSDVLFEVIRPLIRNLRDIRRYVAAVRGTVRGMQGRIELVDVFALEAIRLFLPDVFAALIQAQEALTEPTSMSLHHHEPPELKAAIDALIGTSGDRAAVVKALITRLFPAGGRHIGGSGYGPEWQKTWLRERRVAHIDILKFYLERVLGEQLAAFALAEEAFRALADESVLAQLFKSLEGHQLADTNAALEAFEGEYPVDGIEPASAVLLNQIHRLPQGKGEFRVRPEIVVDRVILRMLRQLETPEAVEEMTRNILPKVKQLSDKFDLITLVGYREGAGHKLVAEDVEAQLKQEFRSQVRAASAEELSRERDVLRLFYWTKKDSESASEDPPVLPRDPVVDAALLKSSLSEVWSQGLGTRAASKEDRLHWTTLVEVVGGQESVVREMVESTGELESEDPRLRRARELAERYLQGWRPKDFGQNE